MGTLGPKAEYTPTPEEIAAGREAALAKRLEEHSKRKKGRDSSPRVKVVKTGNLDGRSSRVQKPLSY